jgi:SET family sugar efflux transporter-like MFS transporter
VSGPIIAVGSLTVLGQRGIFVACAVVTLVGLVVIAVAARTTRRSSGDPEGEPA